MIKKKLRKLMAVAALILGSSPIAGAQQATVAPWQIHKGNEGVLNFYTTFNGDPRAYSKMNIPAISDKGWETAPVNSQNEVSINWSSVLPCNQQIDFTYFQTFVNIPDNFNLSSANISYNKADDGARIYIFNSKYPNGIFDANADITIHQKNSATVDFKDKLAKGENRIVIVQFDDCGDGNSLEGIKISLNGQRVVPAAESRSTSAASSGNNFSEIMGVTQSLRVGGSQLISKNGQYNLILQPDGNLCIYRNKTTFIWCAMTNGKGGERLTFNADGNLCLYNANNSIVWETGTNKGAIRDVGALLMLDDNGLLKIVSANTETLWTSTGSLAQRANNASASENVSTQNSKNTLNLNQELAVSKYLVSNNGLYEFGLCGKGSLVMYKITSGKYSIDWFCGKSSGSRVKLESNGNLVVYGANGANIWSTGTEGRGVVKAVMEDRGDLVLYGSGGQAIWSCKTGNAGTNTHPNPDNSRFGVGYSFKEGEEAATSADDQYGFGIRQGSFCVYRRANGQKTWSCGSTGGTRGAFESNGDLVLYDGGGKALWRSNTGGKGCTRAAIDNSGGFALYNDGGQQVWSSSASNSGMSTTTLADGHYRLWNQYTGSNKVLALNTEGKIYLADKNENDDNQIWIVSAYGNGYRRITNKARGGNFSIDIINDGKNDQLAMAATGNYSGQAWLISSLNNGVFRLTTQWQTEKKSLDVLDIDNKKHVQLATSGNYTGQYWQFVPAAAGNRATGSTTHSTPSAPVVLPSFFKLHAYSIHGQRVEKGSDFYMGFTNGSFDGKIINPNNGNVLQIEKVTIDAGKGIIALKIINATQPDMYLSVNDNKNVTIVQGTSGNRHHFYVRTPEEKEAANLSYVSFESVAFPNWFLRHQGFVLKVSEGNEANRRDVVYRQDATWLFETIR